MSNHRNPNSNMRDSPRHGRTRSVSVNHAAPPQLAPYPVGPTSPPHGHRPIPTLARTRDQAPDDLQNFTERSVEPFCRWAFMVIDGHNREQPNYNFTPDLQNAVWVSETIDAFDNDPRLIHELILRISDLELGSEGFESIRQNRSIVEILLYRHYQRHGGLMLPPTAAGHQAHQEHRRVVQEAREECLRRTGRALRAEEYPRIRWPAWNQPAAREPRGGANPFGAPGDGMRRGPRGGGAGDGGVNV